MVEWLTEYYLRLIVNYQILMGNPTACGAVELLRLFTWTLLGVLGLKLLFHIAFFHLLHRRFAPYREGGYPRLWRVYRRAAARVGLRRVPRLFCFVNARPLVFTIGTLRPTVFVAPRLVHELADRSLKRPWCTS